ncbi:major facilitator superfamily domain-containing protein [Lipomyces tetrasporus]|uniref:Major facilitator superfamily domain-containing protein n=1 Tax=Lipomyces tetrasporus TaxID=54092 RepID=A0AAD7QR72_9ASCO|nr:major facilitator superfamily domain-containing protein [Lipomyces tetrasporus]KAJ8098282.1 major facilitator superfamily domain-containing protein [Lipomyces tetrasporus]
MYQAAMAASSSFISSAAIDMESVSVTSSAPNASYASVRRPSDAMTRSSKTVLIQYSIDGIGRDPTKRDLRSTDAIELSDLVVNSDRASDVAAEAEEASIGSGRSSPESNSRADGEPEVQRVYTFAEIPMNKWRLVACCWTVLALGMNDGAPGALLPYMEEYYKVNYAEVSTIWMANTVGFIVTAVISHYVYVRIGRVGMLTVGPALLVVMYALIVSAPPFPVVIVGFFCGGLGMACVVANVNVFLTYLAHTEACFGLVHGSYGFGATISPLIATAMVSRGIKWSYFYFILLLFNAVGTLLSAWAFKGCDYDLGTLHMLKKYQKLRSAAITRDAIVPVTSVASNMPPMTVGLENPVSLEKEKSVYRQALRDRVTWLAAALILFYQGAEVSIGGWIVSFMIDSRHGDPTAVGYVASGFWAGITIGRFVLNQFLTKLLSPRLVIYILLGVAASFELITWLVPNIVGGAVAVSIVGLVVGPMYPSAITAISQLLPRRSQNFSLTIVTAFGSCGGALWPFITGLLAQTKGTYVVHPVAIGLFTGMSVCWSFIPFSRRKRD